MNTQRTQVTDDTPITAIGGEYAAMREEYVFICNGDHAAAALLNYLVQYSSWKRQKGYDTAVKVSVSDLRYRLMGQFCESSIKRAARWLKDIGYICAAPDRASDRSVVYSVVADTINAAFAHWVNIPDDYAHWVNIPDERSQYVSIGYVQPMDQVNLTDGELNLPNGRVNLPNGRVKITDPYEVEAKAKTEAEAKAGTKAAATRVSARDEKIAAAAAGPDPSKTRAVSVERHALIDAWALAHGDAGRSVAITSDLQALAEALAAEGVTADELRQMVADKLAARDDDYSFRFIRQDFAAWRNARYRAQIARTDSPPARAQAPQTRRYEAEAWTAPADPVPAVPALFDARYRAIFEKAWLTLNNQGHNDVTIRMNWRHLAALKLMDSDGTRYTLATESPAARDCTQRWLKNIERVLFDAGAPRDVVAEVLSADEWRERVKQTTRQPAATAAAASF